MKFINTTQFKAYIANLSKKYSIDPATFYQNYMMERLVERISLSPYCVHLVFKGGFLIASMAGLQVRTTNELDVTFKGILPPRGNTLEKMVREIMVIDAGDGVSFELRGTKCIRPKSKTEDLRFILRAWFNDVRVDIQFDVTSGEEIILPQVDYDLIMMFDERLITVRGYSIYTILADKMLAILVLNIYSSRTRDLYDIYLLFFVLNDLSRIQLIDTINKTATERGVAEYIQDANKFLEMISENPEFAERWIEYAKKYPLCPWSLACGHHGFA